MNGRTKLAVWKDRARSLRGQLTLLAAAYAGAVGLAVAAICLRSTFFERYVREKVVPLTVAQAEAVGEIAAGKATIERIAAWSDKEFDALYGGVLEASTADPRGRLLAGLAESETPRLLRRIRGTLVVGSPTQRLRAVELLGAISGEEWLPEVRELCEFARRRAARRGEEPLRRAGENLIHQLQLGRDDP